MIEKIWIKGFRNIREGILSFDPHSTTLIYGKNNQGKTSILEAIAVALTGKSPIEEELGRCVSFDIESAYLGVDVQIENSLERIYGKIQKNGEYSAEKDQKKLGILSLKNRVWVVFISSDDCHLLKESPDFRRKDLDWFCTQIFPEFKGIKSKFESVLKQRNAALKEEVVSKEKVFFWNAPFVTYSHQLVALRKKGLQQIQEQLTQIEFDSFLPKKGLELTYFVHRKEDPIEDYPTFLLQCLENGFMKESVAQYTLYGPNRDDFELLLDHRPFHRYYSRGIQKMVCLWLKWAQFKAIFNVKRQYPILLLDDVFSEMDETTKKQALSQMDQYTQLIYTTISKQDEALFSSVQCYFIEEGKL